MTKEVMIKAIMLMFEEEMAIIENKIDGVSDLRALVGLYKEAIAVMEKTADMVDELEKIEVKPTPSTRSVNPSTKWGICDVCGREQKYMMSPNSVGLVCKYGHGERRTTYITSECMFDGIEPGTITGLVCNCPRCSPRC